MQFSGLPILNNKLVSVEDMGKLIDALDNTWEQGQSFTSSIERGANRENCIYLFPKRNMQSDACLNQIKAIVDKYGVKSDIHVTHYHGVRQVVRMIIENPNQGVEYREFGNMVAMFVRMAAEEQARIAEQKRIEAERAARQAKIAKIFPFVRLFQKKK